jgi:hypothetical protein
MTRGSVRKATVRIRAPHRRQVSGSPSNTLRISRAQLARLFDFGSPAVPATGFGEAPSSAAR